MTRHPFYLLWGLAVLGLLGAAEVRGWTIGPRREARAVPRTVRENPGAYRPIYRGSGGRYLRGK